MRSSGSRVGWKLFFVVCTKFNSSQDFFLYCKNVGVDGNSLEQLFCGNDLCNYYKIIPPEHFLCSVAATGLSLFAREHGKEFLIYTEIVL